MPFFSKVFKAKDDSRQKSVATLPSSNGPPKVQWSDAWLRTRVDPEEVAELLHECTAEVKSRGLDVPLLLLPFRPSSDPSAARTFVRNFFFPPNERERLTGSALRSELRMTEVIITVMKWCWARLPGGIVTWETYEGFKVGEKGSRYSRDAFKTFIPICVDTKPRAPIIFDFFDLLAAIAAHGKSNGLGGLKLSRFAGWWAFGHIDTGKGFDAGYKSWDTAADSSSHLFFAYLRSMSPDQGKTNGILSLPRSLQQLLDSVQYPPPRSLILNETTKVVMIVDVVSPTPYALLRRAKNFEYRNSDRALQEFASYEDPVETLTDECRRVLRAISSANESAVSDAKTSTSLADPSWSRFEDIGFGSTLEEAGDGEDWFAARPRGLLESQSKSNVDDLGRPTTPSWADFLSSGFADENGNKVMRPVFLPPDKVLPPLGGVARGQSSQSHRRDLGNQKSLDPGELAGISTTYIDDAFWWVWISSLASEEPVSRKAVFGRCAMVETKLPDGRWMVMEEQVKGAAAEPPVGTYIAEKKKSFFSFTTKRGKLSRRRSGVKKEIVQTNGYDAAQRTTLGADQQARIQQVAEELSKKKAAEVEAVKRRVADKENTDRSDRNSIYTLGAITKDDLSPAMQWAKQYDKKEVRAKYLGDDLSGKGHLELLKLPSQGSANASRSTLSSVGKETKDLPAPPQNRSRAQLQVEAAQPATSPTARSSPPSPDPSTKAAKPTQASPALSQTAAARVQPSPVLTQGPSVRAQASRLLAQASGTPAQAPVKAVQAPVKAAQALPNAAQAPPKVAQAPSAQALSTAADASPALSQPAPRAAQASPAVVQAPLNTDAASLEPSKDVPLHEDTAVATEQAESATVPEPGKAGAPSGANKLRKSMDGTRLSSDQRWGQRAQQGTPPVLKNGGIRRLFGTKRPKSRDLDEAGDQYQARPDSPQQSNSAVAAARRALEGKAALANGAGSPPLKPHQFERTKVVKSSIVATQPTVQKPDPARALSPLSHNIVPTKAEARPRDETGTKAEAAPPTGQEARGIPPRARREADEDDQLSRIATSEREHADREFSTFDQGPLLDQPAFVPEDSPVESPEKSLIIDGEEAQAAPKHQSVYSSVSIRKNAAERAAQQSEDKQGPGHAQTTKTDEDGETSGEETIESRVARIKARVAELTGNIDATRR
ncbi:hypothetical protein DV737_g2667, partial [Chaetothyriales sp. CBS 132003]